MATKKNSTTKAVSVVMSEPDKKKNVVKFNNDEEGAAMSSVYISNATIKALGEPDKVKITIEAA
jgi:hypothetical protein